MNRTAILILNHYKTPHLIALYKQLVKTCDPSADVFLLSDRTQISLCTTRLPEKTREMRFTRADLRTLGYPGKQHLHGKRDGRRNMALGNAELPVLYFWRRHPEYERIWLIEYDVRYSGCWHDFVCYWDACDADLIGTTLTPFNACADWPHWHGVRPASTDRNTWIRGFFPVYRLSRQALSVLDIAYRDGCAGHMEGLMPTTLHHAGLKLEDIGGDGPFVAQSNINRFYRNNPANHTYGPGTFIYRPVMEHEGDQPNTLWHPVKPPENHVRRLAERVINRLKPAPS